MLTQQTAFDSDNCIPMLSAGNCCRLFFWVLDINAGREICHCADPGCYQRGRKRRSLLPNPLGFIASVSQQGVHVVAGKRRGAAE